MCCLKVSPWSKITPRYLQCFDQGKSVLLSAILYLSLLSWLKRENRMDYSLIVSIAAKFMYFFTVKKITLRTKNSHSMVHRFHWNTSKVWMINHLLSIIMHKFLQNDSKSSHNLAICWFQKIFISKWNLDVFLRWWSLLNTLIHFIIHRFNKDTTKV